MFFKFIYIFVFEKFEKIEMVDLSQYSTMKVGGKARFMLFPKNTDELTEIFDICKVMDMKTFVLGNGSNVLFDDNGFDGAIVSLKKFDSFSVDGEDVWVGAGVNLFALNILLKEHELSGLEWSFGIPASLGGFLFINGGCFGHEIGDFVLEVVVLDDNRARTIGKHDCGFAYRSSALQKYVILGAKLHLKHEKRAIIQQNMNFYLKKKRESQPCDLPSLGSVFKVVKSNPEVHPAKLIDKLGLKGVKIGKAEVSTKHAGFIVNTGGATSKDILSLIELLEEKLREIGVFVEREIVVLKEDDKWTSGKRDLWR